MELKVSVCKLSLIGQKIFNDKQAVIGYKLCLPREKFLEIPVAVSQKTPLSQ